MSDLYLIWSIEHQAWWGPDQAGYVHQLSRAGRYNRVEMLDICVGSIPGTAHMLKQFPEIPVAVDDLIEIAQEHESRYPATGELGE
jgi:hypothetical protein